ncbi:unnamed protein product [Prunus armeniaca]
MGLAVRQGQPICGDSGFGLFNKWDLCLGGWVPWSWSHEHGLCLVTAWASLGSVEELSFMVLGVVILVAESLTRWELGTRSWALKLDRELASAAGTEAQGVGPTVNRPRCGLLVEASHLEILEKDFQKVRRRKRDFRRIPCGGAVTKVISGDSFVVMQTRMNTLNMSMNMMDTLNIGMNLLNVCIHIKKHMYESSDKESPNPPAFGGDDTESEEASEYVCSEDESAQTEESYNEMQRNYKVLEAVANRVLAMSRSLEIPSGGFNDDFYRYVSAWLQTTVASLGADDVGQVGVCAGAI